MNETLDDIVAWIREIAQSWRQSNSYDKVTIGGLGVCDALEKIADRIEAAHKREVDKLNSVIQAQRSAFDAEQDRQRRAAPGNAAAMREALKDAGKAAAEIIQALRMPRRVNLAMNTANYITGVCARALAVPARNCDVYDKEEVRMAYHLHGDGLMTMQAVVDWLYSAKKKRGDESPRTEQEGEVENG